MEKAKIGIIGGSGVYKIEGIKEIEVLDIDTPFGKPSDKITICEIEGKNVAFLPRHGVGHRYMPTELPVKANIYALKSIGVEKIISISAVGSLKEEIKPKDFVIPNQLIDRTKHRDSTFFGDGIVAHVAFAEPFCPDLQVLLYDTLKEMGVSVHKDQIYVCMEGPAFSTKAESNLYRSWGAGVIGMTAIPEAKLAREAEICYAVIALSTDYDCWHEEEESVTIDMVLENVKYNTGTVKKAIPLIVKKLTDERNCICKNAGEFAVMSDLSIAPEETKEKLKLFYGKYWNK